MRGRVFWRAAAVRVGVWRPVVRGAVFRRWGAPGLSPHRHVRNLVPSTLWALLGGDRVGSAMRLHAAGREVTLSRGTAGKVWVLPE